MGQLSTGGDRGHTTETMDTDTDEASLLGLVRTALLAIIIGASAYVVARWLRSSAPEPTATVREKADEVLEERTPIDGLTIPIGEPGDREDEESEAEETAHSDEDGETEGAETETEPSDSESPDEADALESDISDDRTPDEQDELATENIQKEPAEPGEMTVDEEIVDDVLDEDETDEE